MVMTLSESRALVLEDTELGRWALSRALEAAGFDVRAVSTWTEASAYLLEEQFGLALVAASSILDNIVETVTGIGRDYPDTHLILLADQDTIEGLVPLCGAATDILPKPLDLGMVAQVARARAGLGGQFFD